MSLFLPEKKWWTSSVNHEKISLTIKSAIIFVPSLVILLGVFGFRTSPEDLTEIINQLAVITSGIGLIYGLLRKFYYTRE